MQKLAKQVIWGFVALAALAAFRGESGNVMAFAVAVYFLENGKWED